MKKYITITVLGLIAMDSLSACTEGHGYTASSPQPSAQAREFLRQHEKHPTTSDSESSSTSDSK